MPVRSLAAAVLLASACSAPSAQSTKQPAPSDVVATVGSASITLAEVDDKALQQPVSNFGGRLVEALYDSRRAVIDELVSSRLLDQEAKAQQIERSALIEKEITSKIPSVTDTDVATWYQANQGRLQGATLDQARAPIRSYLTQERMQSVRQQYLGTLKAKTPVRVLLDPPRQKVSAANGASRGPAGAPIEIIEFSDFQCPYCQRANPAIAQVLSAYGDRIHFVYRHFPLANHPNAKPAAEASSCANDQGKFWPYHDRLFANPGKLGDADLKQHAAELGLDTARFNACFDSHKYAAQVDTDFREGTEAGVNGTPAFFINGRILSGAQPFDAFKRIIDEELAIKSR